MKRSSLRRSIGTAGAAASLFVIWGSAAAQTRNTSYGRVGLSFAPSYRHPGTHEAKEDEGADCDICPLINAHGIVASVRRLITATVCASMRMLSTVVSRMAALSSVRNAGGTITPLCCSRRANHTSAPSKTTSRARPCNSVVFHRAWPTAPDKPPRSRSVSSKRSTAALVTTASSPTRGRLQ